MATKMLQLKKSVYVMILLLSGAFHAIAAETHHVQEEADRVTLTARINQNMLLQWQPLVIYLRLENNSANSYEIIPQVDFLKGCMVYITPPNRNEQFVCNSINTQREVLHREKLEPGKVCYGRIFIDTCILGKLNSAINEGEFVPLNKTGHYSIQLKWPLHSVPAPEPDSNGSIHYSVAYASLELDVVEPAGRNLEAFNAWKNALKEVGFQGIPDSGPDAEALMTTYADTIYGQYVQYRNCTIQRTPTPANLPAPPEPGTPEYEFFLQPVAGYNAFLQKYPDFPLADKLMGEIAKFSSIENLQSLLDTLKQKYPYSVEIPNVEALLAERIESKRLRETNEATKAVGQE